MKNKYTIIFAILTFTQSFYSQNWSVGSVWTYEQGDYFPPFNKNDVISLYILKDTLIDLKKYGIVNEVVWNDLEIDEIIYTSFNNAFLRKDGDKIYAYSTELSKELLLYDFGLKIGDTLSFYIPSKFNIFHGNEQKAVLDSISFDEYYGKEIFHFDHYQNDHIVFREVIKDLGCLYYLFGEVGFSDPPPGSRLLCHHYNDITIPESIDCNLISSTIDPKLSNHNTYLYPNKTNGVVFAKENNFIKVEIFDLQGRILNYQNMINILDFSSFSSGIYLISLIDENGNRHNEMIAKY